MAGFAGGQRVIDARMNCYCPARRGPGRNPLHRPDARLPLRPSIATVTPRLLTRTRARPKARREPIIIAFRNRRKPTGCGDRVSPRRRPVSRQDRQYVSPDEYGAITKSRTSAALGKLPSTGPFQQIAWSLPFGFAGRQRQWQKFRYCWRRRKIRPSLMVGAPVHRRAHFVLPFLGAGARQASQRSQKHSPRSTYRLQRQDATQRTTCFALGQALQLFFHCERPVARSVARPTGRIQL